MTNEEIVQKIQAGENRTYNLSLLYDKNKGLISLYANKYNGLAEYEDLMQEGFIGMNEAVDHFDPDQGSSFTTYCKFWIRQAMQRYLDNNGSIRIPVYAGDLVKRYNRICQDYLQEFGSEPSEGVLCRLLGVDKEKLQAIEQSASFGQIRSLDEPLNEDGESVGDMLPSDETMDEDAIRRMDAEKMKFELWEAVDELPDDLPDEIHQRYEDEKTLEEIAETQKKSTSGIWQDLHKGEKLLRNSRRNKGYIGYYQEYLDVYSHHVGVEKFQRTGISEVEEIIFKKLDQ